MRRHRLTKHERKIEAKAREEAQREIEAFERERAWAIANNRPVPQAWKGDDSALRGKR